VYVVYGAYSAIKLNLLLISISFLNVGLCFPHLFVMSSSLEDERCHLLFISFYLYNPSFPDYQYYQKYNSHVEIHGFY